MKARIAATESRLIVAEKPSVAADIAKVLGAKNRKGGYWQGADCLVTWAIGHLVELAEPGVINPDWKHWDHKLLPMLPASFPLVVRGDDVAEQFEVVKALLNSPGTVDVICATDAGREGELIFRLIYELAGCTKPFRRLWISSLTPSAIEAGLRNLRPSSEFDCLAAAADLRNKADWLIGMNATRACTLASGKKMRVGRVKTPTLAMVVARELAITKFVPDPYCEVEVVLDGAATPIKATYHYRDFDNPKGKAFSARLPARGTVEVADEMSAELLVERLAGAAAELSVIDARQKVQQAPFLFDLTELQRACNRLVGWTAQHTLDVAQLLYERHKVLSYPRTDSRHLSTAVAETLSPILEHLSAHYETEVEATLLRKPLGPRFVNDREVSDHHAIIPTANSGHHLVEGSDEAFLYDLVCRRLLAAFYPDAIDALTDIVVLAPLGEPTYRLHAAGKAVVADGWRKVDRTTLERDADEATLPAGLRQGMSLRVAEAVVVDKQTRPPKFFTEATLLSAMESAGASLGGELSAAMRERGLGTPATRGPMIEELVASEYMRRDGKSLRATAEGIELIRRVPSQLKSPALTGEWEADLRKIEKGLLKPSGLWAKVEEQVRRVTDEVLKDGVAPRVAPRQQRGRSKAPLAMKKGAARE